MYESNPDRRRLQLIEEQIFIYDTEISKSPCWNWEPFTGYETEPCKSWAEQKIQNDQMRAKQKLRTNKMRDYITQEHKEDLRIITNES